MIVQGQLKSTSRIFSDQSQIDHLVATVSAVVTVTTVSPGGPGTRAGIGRVMEGVGVSGVGALGVVGVLVDPERVDTPVGLSESRGVVLDVRLAGPVLERAGTEGPRITSPVTTESNVKDLMNISIKHQLQDGDKRARDLQAEALGSES